MGLLLKMKNHHHHPLASKLQEQNGSKRDTFIQAHRAWLLKLFLLYILLMAIISYCIYIKMDVDTKVRRKEILGSLCDQRARMLQDQFSVSVNHVHALAILVSTFHYYRNPSAIDQVCPSKFDISVLEMKKTQSLVCVCVCVCVFF
jgi:histidine kinase 2/3/4 (cytokinin receptor)